MTIELNEAKAPAYLKIAAYGGAGSGKTYTMAQLLSQFIKEYAPELQLAMYDTEGGAGFIGPMVKEITGKPLLAIAATSFSELREFLALCPGKYVGLVDSATHPWRTLCEDYLAAKRSRVEGAGGNPQTVRLALADWGPIKEMWNKGFSDQFKFLPAHLCYCGRAGDVWETFKDAEGEKQIQTTGTKMKIESESAYEPSLLIEMLREPNPAYARKQSSTQWLHRAEVVKDRNSGPGRLTGLSADDPDIAFFRPHIDFLLGGEHRAPNPKPDTTFNAGIGKNWETIKRERQAMLDEIKDDLVSAFPGRSAGENKAKVDLLRKAFGTSSWTALEGDEKKYSAQILYDGREKLLQLIAKQPSLKAKESNEETK